MMYVHYSVWLCCKLELYVGTGLYRRGWLENLPRVGEYVSFLDTSQIGAGPEWRLHVEGVTNCKHPGESLQFGSYIVESIAHFPEADAEDDESGVSALVDFGELAPDEHSYLNMMCEQLSHDGFAMSLRHEWDFSDCEPGTAICRVDDELCLLDAFEIQIARLCGFDYRIEESRLNERPRGLGAEKYAEGHFRQCPHCYCWTVGGELFDHERTCDSRGLSKLPTNEPPVQLHRPVDFSERLDGSLTVAQFCKRFGISRAKVQQLIASGELYAVDTSHRGATNRRFRIPLSEVNKFAKQQE